MSSKWVTIKAKDIVTRTGPHNWGKAKSFHWPLCLKCGLVWLNNAISAKAAKHPCDG